MINPIFIGLPVQRRLNNFVNKYDWVYSLENLNMIGTGFSFILSDDHKYLNYGSISVNDD